MILVYTKRRHVEAVNLGPQSPHLRHQDPVLTLQSFAEGSIKCFHVDTYSRGFSIHDKLQRTTFPDKAAAEVPLQTVKDTEGWPSL